MPSRHSISRRGRRATVATAILVALSAIIALTPTTAFATVHPKWRDAEKFYLYLLNCTRTGGWVLEDGRCDGYGSGSHSPYRPPLTRHWGISRDVARPYARVLIRVDGCDHYFDGTPSSRMHRAGYDGYAMGENVACFWSGGVRRAMVRTQHIFQAEKSYQGGHWRNLKKRIFTTVGIGLWRHGDRTRLVMDFYRANAPAP